MRRDQLLKSFLRYVSLNVLGMLGASCYILADTFFIARWIGADGLAALNLAIPVNSIIAGIGMMLGMGGGTEYAIRKTADKTEEGCRVFTHVMRMFLIASAVFEVLGIQYSGEIASLLGADAKTFEMTQTYLQVLLLFAPTYMLNSILQCFIRNDGAPGLVMTAIMTGNIANIFLDWLFISRLDFGIFGAVFATCLAPIISLAVLGTFFLRRLQWFRLTATPAEMGECVRILSVGAHSLVTELSNAVVMIVCNLLMLRFAGNTGVAAYSIIANLALVVIAVYNGIAQGVQPLVSEACGMEQTDTAYLLLRYASTTSMIVFCVIYLGIFFCARPIAILLGSDMNPELQRLAVTGLRLYFLGAGMAGVNIVRSVWLSSLRHAGRSNTVTLLRGVVLSIPLAYLLTQALGVNGLWLTFPVTEFLVCIVSGLMIRNVQAGRRD